MKGALRQATGRRVQASFSGWWLALLFACPSVARVRILTRLPDEEHTAPDLPPGRTPTMRHRCIGIVLIVSFVIRRVSGGSLRGHVM